MQHAFSRASILLPLLLVLTAPILLGLILPTTTMAAPVALKRVLVLNSYHPNYAWNEKLVSGIRSILDPLNREVKVRYEYMDTKHFQPEDIFDHLYQTYRLKYQDMHFDVIIASDNNALNFLQAYRDDLFPGSPVVFCGVNGYSKEMLTVGNITGIAESYDLEGTLKLALDIHPKTTHIAVVAGLSVSSRINLAAARSLASRYTDRVAFVFLSGLSLTELQHRLHQLPPTTVILFISNYLLPDGVTLTVSESTSFIFENTGLPIYSPWDYTMGWGVLGGMALSAEEQGIAAARVALDILDGTPAAAIPVRLESPIRPTFDWNIMQKLKIRRSILPEGALLLNQPESFIKRYKWLVLGVILFISYQMTVIFYLLQVISRRKRAEASLKREEQRLELLLMINQMENGPEQEIWRVYLERSLYLFDGVTSAITLLRDGVPAFSYRANREGKTGKVSFSAPDMPASPIGFQEAFSAPSGSVVHLDQDSLTSYENRDAPGQRMVLALYDTTEPLGLIEIGRLNDPFDTADERQFVLLADGVQRLLQHRLSLERESRLENQLRHAQRMEAIGTFAGGIAHDFNNILGAIRTCAELAHGELDETTKAKEDLRQVLKASERGQNLVKQILDFSRRQDNTRQPVAIAPIAEECHDLLRSLLPSSIRLHFFNLANTAMVLADPNQIHQVLMNLCTNAQYAMGNQGGRLEITLSVMDYEATTSDTPLPLPQGRYVRISVSDSGCGIDPDNVKRIFDPFFTTRDDGHGTGLGLAMSLGIIKRHRGAITVESILHQGTTFHIYLPCAHGSLDTSSPEDTPPLLRLHGSLLLVDDDLEMRTSVSRLLCRCGLTVVEAHDGAEALEKLQGGGALPTCVLTDFTMPGQNGLELARSISTRMPGLPVLLYTGHADAVQRALGTAQPSDFGVVRIIEKPFTNNQFIQAVHQTLLQGEQGGRHGRDPDYR